MGKLYGAIGGRKSRRIITPEQQAAMQEGRKRTKRVLTSEQQEAMQEGRRKRRHLNYAQAPVREVRS
jgi:Spy/CpxP family protein refolding chaperone